MKDGIYQYNDVENNCICEVVNGKAKLIHDINNKSLDSWTVKTENLYKLIYAYPLTTDNVKPLEKFRILGSSDTYIKYEGEFYKAVVLNNKEIKLV